MNDPFADDLTRAVYHGAPRIPARTLPRRLQHIARRRMDMLQAAATIADLRSSPAIHLEPMPGGLVSPFSLRLQAGWRIKFHWSGAGARAIQLTRRTE